MTDRNRGNRRPSCSVVALLLSVQLALPCVADGQRSDVRVVSRLAVDQRRSDSTGAARRASIARSIMSQVRYAALITHAAGGEASARTIDPLAPDSDFVVRFATNSRSRKLREIDRDRHVTLYYADPARLAYVSLYGTARVLRSTRDRATYWKPEWAPHYPDRDRDMTLVEVTPERLEIVSIADGLTGDSLTWAPPTLRVRPRRR